MKIIQPLLVSMLLLSLSGCFGTSPEDVARQYWDAVLAGDEQQAKALSVDPEEAGLETFIQPGSGSSVTFGETIIDGENAEVPTVLTWVDENNTVSYQLSTALVKQDKDWQVDAYATRRSLINSVYNSTLTDLQKAFEDSAAEFRRLGEELVEEVSADISEASRELEQNAREAGEELDGFLQKLDQKLVEELKKHSGN